MVWQRNMLLNHSVFVKRKHNLLSPNGDNDLNITLYPYSAIKPFVRGKTHTVSAGFSAVSNAAPTDRSHAVTVGTSLSAIAYAAPADRSHAIGVGCKQLAVCLFAPYHLIHPLS